MKMKRTWRFSVLAALCVSAPGLAEAFKCPVLIQDAKTVLNAAKGPTAAGTRRFMEEARALIDDARAVHQAARSADDHNRAMAKARAARVAAERARALGK